MTAADQKVLLDSAPEKLKGDAPEAATIRTAVAEAFKAAGQMPPLWTHLSLDAGTFDPATLADQPKVVDGSDVGNAVHKAINGALERRPDLVPPLWSYWPVD